MTCIAYKLFLLANKLTLNGDKTDYMIIGTRQKLNHLSHDMEVYIGEKTLKQVTSKNVLGVKAAFHFRVFHTHVYARKTLNRLKH